MYLGLWREINGDEAGAKERIKRANRTAYARLSGDYMANVTRACTSALEGGERAVISFPSVLVRVLCNESSA